MALLKHAPALAAALVIAACGLTRDPTAIEIDDERVQVNAVLIAGDGEAAVLVTRAVSPSQPGGGSWVRPVEDAVVSLVRGETVTRLETGGSRPCISPFYRAPTEADELDRGCYTATLPVPIQPGATYELRIELADGESIHGATAVPTAPTLASPMAGDTLRYGEGSAPPVEVRWSPTPPDHGAELHVGPHAEGCHAWLRIRPNVSTASLDVTGTDSVRTAISLVDCQAGHSMPAVAPADIVLTVFEPAYSRYLEILGRGGSALTEAEATVGLTGSLGVFTAAAQARREVVLAPWP